MEVALSRHASRRMRQRGIPREVAEILFNHSDRSVHAGDECETIWLSGDACQELLSEGASPAFVECACRVAAIYSQRSGMAVTFLRPRRGVSGARFRRQWFTRKRVAKSMRNGIGKP